MPSWCGCGNFRTSTYPVAYTSYLPQDCHIRRICNRMTIKVECAMRNYDYTVPPSHISNFSDSLAITNKPKTKENILTAAMLQLHTL